MKRSLIAFPGEIFRRPTDTSRPTDASLILAELSQSRDRDEEQLWTDDFSKPGPEYVWKTYNQHIMPPERMYRGPFARWPCEVDIDDYAPQSR